MSFVKCSVDGCNARLQPLSKPILRDKSTWVYRECDRCLRPDCEKHSSEVGGEVLTSSLLAYSNRSTWATAQQSIHRWDAAGSCSWSKTFRCLSDGLMPPGQTSTTPTRILCGTPLRASSQART